MQSPRFTSVVDKLPDNTPFVGPEALERKKGEPFLARIGANESAFGLSRFAEAALHEAIGRQGCSWYPDPESQELRDALAQKHGVKPTEICVDAGIDSLLGLTVRMLIEPGRQVVTSEGAYPTFNYHVTGFGGTLHFVPYRGAFEDSEALVQKARSESASLVYLSNPDNPMGTRLNSREIQNMIDDLPITCTLALDEAYADFDVEEHLPAIDTSNPQVIRYRTFSKAYGMAGMRIGYAIADETLISGMNRIRNHFGLSRLAQIAALASLQDQSMLPDVQNRVQQGRRKIEEMAKQLNLTYVPSHTNFVAVDLGSSSRAKKMLTQLGESGVFLRMPGVAPLDRHLRIGVGTPEEHQIFEQQFRQLLSKS